MSADVAARILAEAPIFGHLPGTLFAPLAGPNRQVYADVLGALQPVFFDRDDEEIFPARDTVRLSIEEAVARMARLQWVEEDESERELPLSDAGYAYRIYRRLVACGWLEEEAEGYQVRVVVAPAVAELWHALVEIKRQERVFYGGMVLSIYNNVKGARQAPREQALALREAARLARQFQHHLNAMIYGLKGLLRRAEVLSDRALLLSSFFDDFVQDFLVGDYKRLKTANNPFHYRGRILQLVNEVRFDETQRQAFTDGYQEHLELRDWGRAEAILHQDLLTLAHVFSHVEQHLARLDRYRARFEQRAADAIRYMDRSLPGMAARLNRLLERFGERLPAAGGEEGEWEVVQLARPLPIGDTSLYQPREARRPPEPVLLRERVPDPRRLELQKAFRDYLARRQVRPADIVAYVERHLGDGDAVEGAALRIESVEDYVVFSHLRRLTMGGKAARTGLRVERLEGWMDNGWVRCRGFRVVRG